MQSTQQMLTAIWPLHAYLPATMHAACSMLSICCVGCMPCMMRSFPPQWACCQVSLRVHASPATPSKPLKHAMRLANCPLYARSAQLPPCMQCAAYSAHTAYTTLRAYPPASPHALRSLLSTYRLRRLTHIPACQHACRVQPAQHTPSTYCLQRPARIPACHHACNMQPAQHTLPTTACAHNHLPARMHCAAYSAHTVYNAVRA